MENRRFKGSSSEYTLLHNKIKEQLDPPNECTLCREVKKMELANISQEYKDDVEDWMYLCSPCHKKFDSHNYSFRGGEWFKRCLLCRRWFSVSEGFYQRKSTQVKNGKTYPRVDSVSWCKGCSREWGKEITQKRKLKRNSK